MGDKSILSESDQSDDELIMEDDQMDQPILSQIELYIKFKPKFDKFYQEFYSANKDAEIQTIMQKYLKSSTKLKFLQNGFKTRE